MLELHGIRRSYPGVAVVGPIDLRVDAGETVALIGPSGCGKSTLLRVAIGLDTPERGHVVFDGGVVSSRAWRGIRRRTGYVIQEGGLFPHLSARENVSLPARHHGMSAGAIEARIGELGELVRLDPAMLDRPPARLSGGQRQRVALMRALVLDPALLLLDEPLGALDPLIRYELQGELKRIFAALKKAVLIVTHDLAEAEYFADRVVLLRDGSIAQQGPPEDLLERPADEFVRTFVRAQRGHQRGEGDDGA
ncbi:MAG: ATP-binding cassette domain-containing protein [Planctomycetota bacterium]